MKNTLFKLFLWLIFLFFTGLLFAAILSLFFMLNLDDILINLRSEEMFYSLKLSIFSSALSTFIVMVVAVSSGYVLARFQFRGQHLFRTIIDLPMALPELVLGLCLLLLLGQGPLSLWSKNIVFSKEAIVIAQIFTAAPYAIRIMYGTFCSINPRYELVARSLGCDLVSCFFRVSLPMAKGGFLAAIVIAFARSVGCFGTVLVLAGGTRMYTETLPIALFLNISYGNLPVAITAGVVLIIISLLSILIFECMNRDVFV
ncbi:MAG: ABC transporter permease subunit [Aminobacterium sp.]|jgi:molybdate transport system permease protein|nr:ABC transporter permease subunit [Aminobacterium sp.]MEA4878407.1 ABC transporter permease subunit [Aminobacterium sp.]